MAVTDALVLGTKVDGTLLVIGPGKTPREMALMSKVALGNVQAKVRGVVFNKLSAAGSDGVYGSYYGYYYHYYHSDEES